MHCANAFQSECANFAMLCAFRPSSCSVVALNSCFVFAIQLKSPNIPIFAARSARARCFRRLDNNHFLPTTKRCRPRSLRHTTGKVSINIFSNSKPRGVVVSARPPAGAAAAALQQALRQRRHVRVIVRVQHQEGVETAEVSA